MSLIVARQLAVHLVCCCYCTASRCVWASCSTSDEARLRARCFPSADIQVCLQQFCTFLGTVKDKSRVHQGSPIQLDFPSTASAVPHSMRPWNASVPPCWSNALRCACGDCPDSPTCNIPSGSSGGHTGPCKIHLLGGAAVRCLDVAVWLPGLLLAALLVWLFRQGKLTPSMSKDGAPRCRTLAC